MLMLFNLVCSLCICWFGVCFQHQCRRDITNLYLDIAGTVVGGALLLLLNHCVYSYVYVQQHHYSFCCCYPLQGTKQSIGCCSVVFIIRSDSHALLFFFIILIRDIVFKYLLWFPYMYQHSFHSSTLCLHRNCRTNSSLSVYSFANLEFGTTLWLQFK